MIPETLLNDLQKTNEQFANGCESHLKWQLFRDGKNFQSLLLLTAATVAAAVDDRNRNDGALIIEN